MRVAVVGHVEWVHFASVERLPRPGEILRARQSFTAPAGGGAMAAFEMARLGVETHFFTTYGQDEAGSKARRALDGRGLQVHAVERAAPHPQVFVYLTDDHERTITVLDSPLAPRGEDLLPWDVLAGVDAVYFCKGDVAALRAARQARILVATARALPLLQEARIPVDVLVASAADSGERYRDGDLDPAPAAVVLTEGKRGGTWRSGGREGRYETVAPPAILQDSYGAGDSFAGGLTVALGRGLELGDALSEAARSGAAALGRIGGG